MRKPYAIVGALALAAALLAAAAAGPASAKDLVTIPLDKRVPTVNDVVVHLVQVTVSDTTYGGSSWVPDPENYLYPVLVYTFENGGTTPQIGHLHVQFVDDRGEVYDAVDPGNMVPLAAGKTSEPRTVEIHIPKDRRLVRLVVIEGFDRITFPLTYPGSTAPATVSPSPSSSGTPAASPSGGLCAGALLLPLALVGTLWAGKRVAKK